VAFVSAAVHTVAAAAMLVVLRPGLPPDSVERRIAFITSHRTQWTMGWLCWTVTAITLVALVIVLARRVGTVIPVILVLGGAYFDVTSQVRYIIEMPQTRGETFLALDRQLEVSIGVVANGLYTLAMAALVLKRDRLPRRVRLLAMPVIVAGAVLAVAAFLHQPLAEIISSAILFPAFIIWSVDVGRWLLADA
jgi:hypothetical protein